jgi:hypothetical protein
MIDIRNSTSSIEPDIGLLKKYRPATSAAVRNIMQVSAVVAMTVNTPVTNLVTLSDQVGCITHLSPISSSKDF